MSNKFTKYKKNPFIRNVIILATGTAMAQAINMAFSPIITRIYGPEAFGVLGVFLAMVGIIAPVAALTYPVAIVLPRNEDDAKGLIRLSLTVAGVIALAVTIIIFCFNDAIVSIFRVETIAHFLYFIPLIILFSAFLQVMQQWLIRTKEYKVTAKIGLIQALLLNSAKVGIGWFYPVASVLVTLSTFGNATHALMLVKSGRRSHRPLQAVKHIDIKELALKYRDFPLFRAPQVLLNSVSQTLPVLLLASFFGPTSAGFYTLCNRVLGLPISLIGKSVGDVFYPKITEVANNNKSLRPLIIKATLALAAIGLLPFGMIVAFGPIIFDFVFGDEWVLAGEYSRWLSLYFFFRFINRPCVTAIPVLNLQGKFLIYEIVSFLLKLGALILGFFLLGNDIYAIILFSIAGVLTYVYLIIWIIKSSKKNM